MKILDFYADWCGPCKLQASYLSQVDVEVEKINVEEESNAELVEKYNVRNLPLLILLNDAGENIYRFNGLTQVARLQEVIEACSK